MITIELPFATPSLNEILGWRHNPKTRGWRYRQHKDSVLAVLRFHLGAVRLAALLSAPRRMRVVFTRLSAGTLDDDNLAGGFKAVRDALKDLGVIQDDTPRWLEAVYRQVKTKRGDKRTRIEIEAVP